MLGHLQTTYTRTWLATPEFDAKLLFPRCCFRPCCTQHACICMLPLHGSFALMLGKLEATWTGEDAIIVGRGLQLPATKTMKKLQMDRLCRSTSPCQRLQRVLDNFDALNRMQTRFTDSPNQGPTQWHAYYEPYGRESEYLSSPEHGRQDTPCRTTAPTHSYQSLQLGIRRGTLSPQPPLGTFPYPTSPVGTPAHMQPQSQSTAGPQVAVHTSPAAPGFVDADSHRNEAYVEDSRRACTRQSNDGAAQDSVRADFTSRSPQEHRTLKAYSGQRSCRAKRRFTVQDVIPPQHVSDEQLRYARIAYREEVLRILQKKRKEMAADGYYM
jgi:hypothetical protein